MQQQTPASKPEQEIDLIELAKKVWKERKFIFKACAVGAVVGLVVAFSIPKEYVTLVKLSPEMNGEAAKSGGSLGGLAAMAGVNIGGSGGVDALSVELYPDIVSSTPFLLDLIDVKVTTQDGAFSDSLYVYMHEEQKYAWWNHVVSAPIKALSWGLSLFKEEMEVADGPWLNPFVLNNDQEKYLRLLGTRIMVVTDKKTGVITGSVEMQDPLISATLMDVVLKNLQSYITDYRTRKAKHDLAFTNKLFIEAKGFYFDAQKQYALYMDANKNVVSASFKTEEQRSRNELELTYEVYTQMAQQLDQKKIKVQEQTPVYAVIEPPRVPLKENSPNKVIILLGSIFAFAFMAGLKIVIVYISTLIKKQNA